MSEQRDTTEYLPAGVAGRWRSVQEMVRSNYEETAALVLASIRARTEIGVALDDTRVDWREAAKSRTEAAWKSKDRKEAREHLRAAMAIASEGLAEYPPFRPDPALDGIEVRLRALLKEEHARLAAAINAVVYRGSDHTSAEALRALADQQGPVRRFVSRAVAGIRGVQLEDGEMPPWEGEEMPAAVLDALDSAGLLIVLHSVADKYQDLSPLQRRDFGSSRPSISETSSATHASRSPASNSDAKATSQGDRTFPVSGGKPSDALAASPVTTPGSTTLSMTTAPAMGGQDSTASH